MLETPSLVFLQLQKTGGTHAERLLRAHLGATSAGKHRPMRPGKADGRAVLGGVRNPWDWYVSFFAYGCERRGGITGAYLMADGFSARRRELARFRLPNVPRAAKIASAPAALLHEARHRAKPWEDLLSDIDDVRNFRAYIKRLLDPKERFASAIDYGFSPYADRIGLMTYLYLLLYLKDRAALFSRQSVMERAVNDPGEIEPAIIVDHFVQMEDLENQLAAAVAAAGEADAAAAITAQAGQTRSNTSLRKRDYREFYDDETRALIADRDRLIIERHHYSF